MIYWQDMVRFIRVMSRIDLDPDQKRYCRKFLHQDVPWEQLILLAQSEGVDGLLYHHLCRLDGVGIPEAYRDGLKNRHSEYRRNQASMIDAARCISEHLQQNRLSAITIQGLSLIQIYGTSGIRPMGDMDILVKPDDRDRVVNLLQDIGYRIPNPVYPNNLIKNRLWLDIHTHILNLDRIRSRRYVFPMDLSALWSRAFTLFESSTGILKPDPIDNFVLLSAHALKHGYSRMIWLVDLCELLKSLLSQKNDWNTIIERIRCWRQEKIVSYGLAVLEGISAIQVPRWVKIELGVNQMGYIEKRLLVSTMERVNRPEHYIALWFFAMKGIRKKLKFLKEIFFPEDDVMAQILNDTKNDNRFSATLNRIIRSLQMVGNGIKDMVP